MQGAIIEKAVRRKDAGQWMQGFGGKGGKRQQVFVPDKALRFLAVLLMGKLPSIHFSLISAFRQLAGGPRLAGGQDRGRS